MQLLKTILALALAITAAALVSTQAAPSSDGLYVGTVGTSQVVLKLETFSPDDVSATYYYRRIGRDIALGGLSRANGTFKLTEIALPSREDIARIELTLSGTNLNGTWAELKGKQRVYNIRLRKATAGDFAALKFPNTPAFKQWVAENPLDALRFDAPFKPAKLEMASGKRVQWMMETKSKVTFPRLPQASAAVNNALLLAHYRTASQALQCVLDDYQYNPKVSLYSSRLLSLSATAAYYCGGAHPDAFSDNYTLDLRTAKELTLEDLYRFTPVKIDLDANSDGFITYLQARAKVVQALILTQYRSMVRGIDAGCEDIYATDHNLSYLTWYLSAKGLVVQSSLPHVAAACENSYELPYSSLTKYLAPSSPLK